MARTTRSWILRSSRKTSSIASGRDIPSSRRARARNCGVAVWIPTFRNSGRDDRRAARHGARRARSPRIPVPTARLAEHLRGPDQRTAGWVYAGSFFAIAIVFNVMWRYAVRAKTVFDYINAAAITKQYALGPIMYAVLVIVATFSGV